jgi:hypothetical protein
MLPQCWRKIQLFIRITEATKLYYKVNFANNIWQIQPHIIILAANQAWTFNFGCDGNIAYEVR